MRVTSAKIIAWILDPNRPRCAPTCLGWFVNDADKIVRCDDCASLATMPVTDRMIRRALNRYANLRRAS